MHLYWTMTNIDNEFHGFAEFSFTRKRKTRLVMLELLPEKESSLVEYFSEGKAFTIQL